MLSACALYLALFALLCQTPLYSLEGAHNDRLFSADDLYYVTSIFSVEMDTSARVVKHPLLIVFGWLFTLLESAVLGDVSVRLHYMLIVLLQIAAAMTTLACLYKILDEFYGLPQRRIALLCAVYALAFSSMFYTFVTESYSFSGCILMLTYYCARKKRSAAVTVLGVLAAGVTITNAFLWAAIVLATNTQSLKKRLLLLALGGGCFCVVAALTPAGRIFFRDTLSVCFGSAENYSDHFSPLTALRYALFIFFGSPFFIVDTRDASPFGDYVGDALSFLPSAPPLILAAMGVWCALLLVAALRGRRSSLLPAPLLVLALNFFLHGALQYGLKEGFLYSLHHLSAQVLIVALLFLPKGKTNAANRSPGLWADAAVGVFLISEIALNISGYLNLFHFIEGMSA